MKYDNELDNYVKELKKYNRRFELVDKNEYLKRYINGEKKLFSDIFYMNALLVVECVFKYHLIIKKTNLDMMDCIQYGNLALTRAIETYDFSYNKKFSTYASLLIQQTIVDSIWKYGYSVRMYASGYNKIIEYNRAYNKLFNELKREPTIHELAIELKISDDEVIKIRKYILFQTKNSLNATIGDNEYELIELIKDDNYDELDKKNEEMSRSNIINILRKIGLTDNEYNYIILRYGLLDGIEKKQREISRIMNVCYQYVSKLEKNALTKIKKSKYIYELALITDTPVENLENIGYEKEKILSKLDKINKI